MRTEGVQPSPPPERKRTEPAGDFSLHLAVARESRPQVPEPVRILALAIVRRLSSSPDECAFHVVAAGLGRVRIHISRNTGRVVVRLRAARASTTAALLEHVEALRSALLAAGYASEIEI